MRARIPDADWRIHRMRSGGGNSAYSKPGGAQPLCFATDVSQEMVERYRRLHNLDAEK
jgi:hypothetical protein